MNIFIAGDYCPQLRIAKMVEERNYTFLDEVKKLFDIIEPDFRIVNFETAIGDDNIKPIKKSGPNLKSTPEAMDALKNAGFNVVTLANNHILDYGAEGLDNVVDEAEKKNIKYVGVGKNRKEAQKVLYLNDESGKTLGVINCCEHEYSIAGDDSTGANPLDTIDVCHQIKEAKNKADYVIVIVHGGHEHCHHPSIRQKKTYRFFVESGADAVVNHHQHCYLGYEIYKEKPIFYGLGNFCFDKISDNLPLSWNYGYAVDIEFNKNTTYKIYPFEQCGEKPVVHFLKDRKDFETILFELNKTLLDDNKLKEKLHEFYEANPVLGVTTPVLSGHWYRLRPFVQKHITPQWYYDLRDFITCESHQERIEYELSKLTTF